MQAAELDEIAVAIATALDGQGTVPELPDALSLEDGYAIQARMFARRDPQGSAGLKAGVTQPGSQRHFGIEHALLGRLYSAGRLAPGARLEADAGIAIECELGIIVDAQGRPQGFGPAIEFVRAAFAADEAVTAAKLLASNLAALAFMPGELSPWPYAFTDTGVSLFRDEERILEAKLEDGLGGPVRALDWIRTEAHGRGMVLADGMLLMTGCCGPAPQALPGHYRADYGPLGSIEFDVS